MKESPNMQITNGNALITPSFNHHAVNRSHDFSRQNNPNR